MHFDCAEANLSVFCTVGIVWNSLPSPHQRTVLLRLVLPSDRTLRYEKIQIMNNCQVGIQNGVIARISRAVKSSKNQSIGSPLHRWDDDKRWVFLLKPHWRCTCTCSISFLEDIAYQSTSGKVVGYVEYSSDDLNCLSTSSNRVTSHMLAILVRGLTCRF